MKREGDLIPPPLAAWLRRNGADLGDAISAVRVGAGQSNGTFLLSGPGGDLVLRTPPPGAHGATAHDVVREARIMRALAGKGVPVPAVVAWEEDTRLLEAPFYVMECVPGTVLAGEDKAAALSAEERRRLGDDAVDTLARLHLLDVDAAGLAWLGRREDYVARQAHRLSRQVEGWSEGRAPLAAWREVRDLLTGLVPPQQRSTIVHGDYRLGNLMTAGGSVRAVLDWELCALGDPLADLAWLLDDWRGPDEPAIAMPSPTRAGGFHPREHLIERYARATGLDVGYLPYYRAFSHWRAATLLMGVVHRRNRQPEPDSARTFVEQLEETVEVLLDEALVFLHDVKKGETP